MPTYSVLDLDVAHANVRAWMSVAVTAKQLLDARLNELNDKKPKDAGVIMNSADYVLHTGRVISNNHMLKLINADVMNPDLFDQFVPGREHNPKKLEKWMRIMRDEYANKLLPQIVCEYTQLYQALGTPELFDEETGTLKVYSALSALTTALKYKEEREKLLDSVSDDLAKLQKKAQPPQ
jgi:hypothetical protein